MLRGAIGFAGRPFQRFIQDETGNATVDWTVLVAGLVGLSVTVMISVGGGVEDLADKTDTELSDRNVQQY